MQDLGELAGVWGRGCEAGAASLRREPLGTQGGVRAHRGVPGAGGVGDSFCRSGGCRGEPRGSGL